jgi:hypothetical protein
MPCDLLDLKCIFMNELIGSVMLTLVLAVVFYFIVASRTKLGFDVTIALAIPIIIIMSLMLTSFSVIFAIFTIIVGIMAAWIIQIVVGNR